MQSSKNLAPATLDTSHPATQGSMSHWGGSQCQFALALFVFGIFLKVLLIPAYFSTDFEVHRNWLAITSSLPLTKWYYESTSEWTLDYPPFFAYFEWALSFPAALFDKEMLVVSNLNYSSFYTVLFQRLSAMVSELLFLAGTMALLEDNRVLQTLTYLNPGILFVDHVHFQYNAFLTGIQMLSIAALVRFKRELLGAVAFAALLNFKHIYLYSAPAYFVYLLRHYCQRPNGSSFAFAKFVKLAGSVIAVFALSLGPFASQLPQVLTRLFPFKRGLTHAYWAPNFWAIYSACDRAALQALKFWPLMSKQATPQHASLTRGIIGNVSFAVLPEVKPIATLVLTVAAMLPCLFWLWKKPTPLLFKYAVVLTCFSSYMFGWHVHEKAILLVVIPFSSLLSDFSLESTNEDDGSDSSVSSSELEQKFGEMDAIDHMKATFQPLCVAAYYSLFPLLFKMQEEPIRLLVLIIYCALAFPYLRPVSRHPLVNYRSLYVLGFIPLHGVVNYLLPYYKPSLPFLGLLLVSLYCSLGITYAYIQIYKTALRLYSS